MIDRSLRAPASPKLRTAAVTLAALAAMTVPCLGGEAGALLRPGEVAVSKGVSITEARLLDHRIGVTPRVRVDAFSFVVERTTWLGPGRATLTVTSSHEGLHTFRASIPARSGAETIRISAGLDITGRGEGAFDARLVISAGDDIVFDGAFSFGYPRYTRSAGIRRESTTAFRDAFDGAAVDTGRWRIWLSNPSRARVEQGDGRLWIEADGEVGYNGLAARVRLPMRDVVAVCRAGVDSTQVPGHYAIVHLCGSGPLSPDNWFEVQLRAGAAGGALALIKVSTPDAGKSNPYPGPYTLPGDGARGHLVRIDCDGRTSTCTGRVQTPGGWWQIGDPFEVPARESHLEIKTAGGAPGGSSRIWFDDCRLYPSPATHQVGVLLRRRDGTPPAPAEGQAVCFDRDNAPITGCDLRVQLLEADGVTLIDETTVGTSFGFAMLRLPADGETVYPIAARVRVLAGEIPLGPDQVIESHGVEGLYPDDVYVLTIE